MTRPLDPEIVQIILWHMAGAGAFCGLIGFYLGLGMRR